MRDRKRAAWRYEGVWRTGRGFIAAIALSVLMVLSGPMTLSAASAKSAAGTASGTVTVDGKALNLKYAYAVAQPNTFDETKTDIAVLLSEKALPPDALTNIERLQPVADKYLHGWVHFLVNDKGEPTDEMIEHPALKGMRLMTSGGPGATKATFTSKVFRKDRIEGSFQTGKAVKFLDHTYELKVSFKAPVVQAKRPDPLPDEKTGEKLPADGGEPGKAYMAFVRAVLARDIAGVRKLHEGTENEPDSEIEKGIEFLTLMMPQDLKVTGGYAKEDKAVLSLTGVMGKERQYGSVEMSRNKSGDWQAGREKWSNTPPE